MAKMNRKFSIDEIHLSEAKPREGERERERSNKWIFIYMYVTMCACVCLFGNCFVCISAKRFPLKSDNNDQHAKSNMNKNDEKRRKRRSNQKKKRAHTQTHTCAQASQNHCNVLFKNDNSTH